MTSPAHKQARKRKTEQTINAAAEGVLGLNPLVGASSEDLLDALRSTSRQVLRHPLLATKHGVGLASKWVDVAYGNEDYQPGSRDRRFSDSSWQESALFRRVLQGYLALDESLDEWLEDLDLEDLDRRKARFIVDILTDSLAPTNNLLTNPAALKKARATRGGSLVQGLRHMLDDIRHNNGMPAQVDKSEYEVGTNLATTAGAVVFRNDQLELIQYQPTTAKTRQRPLLVVPPQINKFYVFDLTPEKSMFQHLVNQGIPLFTVSWKNPDAQHRDWGMDDYVRALVEAVQAVQDISGRSSINLAGACSGGITASVLAGYLDACGSQAINSLSLMVCVLSGERSDSDISLFTSDAGIARARRASQRKGVLNGTELARVFNWMRPNDLIWNYVVNNYLMGNRPPAFDILYWNNDTTNLPAQLHSDFLDIIHEDRLANPGRLTVAGKDIDLGKLGCDTYLLAGSTDHITPWHACYRSTHILGGSTRFILSNSGHIQALVNPPGNPKANYFVNETLPRDHREWLEGAEQRTGSWWSDWSDWLARRSGRQVNATEVLGRPGVHEPLEPAPGSYVFGQPR